MSTLRLTFLYPQLFRSPKVNQSLLQTASSAKAAPCRKPGHRASRCAAVFSTSARPRQAPFERHGTAVDPLPVPPDEAKLPPDEAKSPRRDHGRPVHSGGDRARSDGQSAYEPNETDSKAADSSRAPSNAEEKPEATPKEGHAGPKSSEPVSEQAAVEAKKQEGGPMDTVLQMPAPEASQPPHISTPPYVHHFDSYTLVKQLERAGYTEDQAVTVMKAVRSLLAVNLDVAQEGLISRSDVENETYLFKAACSELSSEVKNNRKTADEQSRQQRTMLQHEVDILSQKLSQDLMTLRDDVRGMFNDRKMAVREEQRATEGAIQQINLKISVALNSDSKSEIEGLRWTLIRRSVLGIIFMAFLTLGTLRYGAYVTNERKREAELRQKEEEAVKRTGGREDHAPPVDAAVILTSN